MSSNHFASPRYLPISTWLLTCFVAGCTPSNPVDPAIRESLDQARQEMHYAGLELKAATQELRQAAQALEKAHARHAATGSPNNPMASNPIKLDRAFEGIETGVTCSDEFTCTIKKDFMESLLGDPSKLSRQARIVPRVQDGVTLGYKLYGIRSGSLPKALHFKNGDLISQINGHKLDSLDAAMTMYNKLRHATILEVAIERKGLPLKLKISIL